MKSVILAIHTVFGFPLMGAGLAQRYLYIVVMALASAPISLLLFKRLSRQKRLALLRNRIRGNIMQLSIYPDRFEIVLLSLGAVLADTVRSLAESVLPLIVISIPLSLVMLEVNNYCGSEPLVGGDEFVIRAELRSGEMLADDIGIEHSPDIELVTPILRIPEERTVYWRARVHRNEGNNTSLVRLSIDGYVTAVPIAAGSRLKRFGPRTVKPSFPAGLFSNANGFLPTDSPFEGVSVSYRRAAYPVFWWHLDALVLYIILTMIAALGMKPFIGVQI